MKYRIYSKVALVIYCFLFVMNIGKSQCTETNSSLWENTWESCEMTQSPNPERGKAHWIMYDLGSSYTISTSRVWNSNIDLDKGVKQLIVDYSLDGNTWIVLDTLEIARAEGIAEYPGVPGPDFTNINVRYILFHIASNWGHKECAGFTEIRLMINDQVAGSTANSGNDDDSEDENEDNEDEGEDENEEDDNDETEEEEEETDEEHDEEDCDEDENEVSEGGECTEPFNVTALELNSYEAWLLWEGGNTKSYILYIRTENEEWMEIEVEEPEIFLEELEPGIEYEVFVQAICEEDQTRKSEVIKFIMPDESEECSTPGFSKVFISQEGFAVIVWEESEDRGEYELRYRPLESDEEWEFIRVEENVIEFEDIDIEIHYEYQIRVRCNGEWLDWSEVFNASNENEDNDLISSNDEILEQRSKARSMEVNIYPNPSNQFVQFSVDSDANTTLLIQLSDLSGRSYKLIKRSAQKGFNSYDLEIQNISSGLYFLTIKDMVNQMTKISKVMVLNE